MSTATRLHAKSMLLSIDTWNSNKEYMCVDRTTSRSRLTLGAQEVQNPGEVIPPINDLVPRGLS